MISNPAAERGVLSGIYQYSGQGYLEVSDLINDSSFCIDLNKGLYAIFSHVLEKDINAKVDFHLILATIKELGLDKLFSSDHDYIQKVINLSVDFNNIREFAKTLRKLQVARDLTEKHDQSKTNLKGISGSESISEIISLSESPILDYTNSLSNNNKEGVVLMSDGIDEIITHLKSNPQEIVGISTGFPRLDKAMGGGQRRKSVNIIAARPGIGKTWLTDTIGLYVSGQLNIPVLNLDTEMDKDAHIPRVLASLISHAQARVGKKTDTVITIDDIETGRFAKDSKKANLVDKAVAKFKTMPYSYMNVSGKEFEEILSIARRWILQTVGFDNEGRTNHCLFLYDYLKLMDITELKRGKVQETQLLGAQITALHNFAVKYDIPCTSFVQVNRDGITKETSDIIADSDRILRLASSVFLYKVKDEEEIAEDGGHKTGNRKLCHIKTRYGAGLEEGDYINLLHTKNVGLIQELKTRNELKTEPSDTIAIENEGPIDF